MIMNSVAFVSSAPRCKHATDPKRFHSSYHQARSSFSSRRRNRVYMKSPILDSSPDTTRFDSFDVGSPVVKRFLGDDEERWYCWYEGRTPAADPSDSERLVSRIGLAISTNGIHWEKHNGEYTLQCVMPENTESWWAFDTKNVVPGDVQLLSSLKVRAEGSVFFMFYHGNDSRKLKMGPMTNPSRIGIALSLDGFHWSRIEGHYANHAILDVHPSMDHIVMKYPTVIQTETELVLLYTQYDANKNVGEIHMAKSADGIYWTDVGCVLGMDRGHASGHIGSFGRCSVVRRPGGDYVMFVEYHGSHEDAGIESTSRGIYCATCTSSADLSQWTLDANKPVLSPNIEKDAWDSGNVSHPYAIVHNNQVYLYYQGSKADPSGKRGGYYTETRVKRSIGLAVCKDASTLEFARV